MKKKKNIQTTRSWSFRLTLTLSALSILSAKVEPGSVAHARRRLHAMTRGHGGTPQPGESTRAGAHRRSGALLPTGDPALPAILERPIAVGFSAAPELREALQRRLIEVARYRLDPGAQIPTDPYGLFVGGWLSQLGSEARAAANDRAAGWVDCRARFVISSQPAATTRLVESVAASVPAGPGATGPAACLDELARAIVARLREIAG